MIEAYRGLDDKSNVIAVEEVPPERIHMYGVVGVGKTKGKSFAITEMVEKPPREQAPSNLIITGRYILQPEIFGLLATQEGGAGGEIQLTDAMIKLAKKQPFFGLKFKGRSFDCGSKVGFLAANVAYALARADIAPALRAEIKRLLGEQVAFSAAASARPGTRWRCSPRLRTGAELVVAVLALERELAVELVGDRRRATCACRRGPSRVVEAIADLQRADQPAAEGVIDLQADVAPQHAGHAGDDDLVGLRAAGRASRW